MNNRTEKPRPSGVSRRTVVKGAAWAVPAITVASAVPAVAASRPCVAPPPTIDGCKHSGSSTAWDKTYRAPIVFTNNCTGTAAQDLTIKITGLSWSGSCSIPNRFAIVKGNEPNGTITFPAVGFQFTIDSSYDFYLFWRCSSSSNSTLTFTYEVTDSLNNTTTYTAASAVNFDPSCRCTSPQPPYPVENKNKCEDGEGVSYEVGDCAYDSGCIEVSPGE